MEIKAPKTKQIWFEEIVSLLAVNANLPESSNAEITLADLLSHHKERLRNASDSIKCGFWVQQTAAINHMFDLINALSEYGHIEVLAIMDVEEAIANPQWLLDSKWLDMPLLLCSESSFGQLHELDLLFIQESNFALSFKWPAHLKRIGFQHGNDVSLSKTLVEYGGCLEFDYLLTTKKEKVINEKEYAGYFPKALRQAKSDNVTLIPFGSIKFDKFYQTYKQCRKKDSAIIYHLSNLALEYPWVIDYVEPTLAFLLSHFPEHEIIFRPFPKNLKHPKIIAIEEKFGAQPRFTFSKTSSYIDDYSRGVAMVCHRKYESHLFPLVTGRPMLVFQPVRENTKPTGTIFSYSELAAILEETITSPSDNKLTRNDASVICNPGSSVEYLVSNIGYIKDEIVNPDWSSYSLNLIDSVDTCLEQHQSSYQPFNKLALAAWKKQPNNIKYVLTAVESLSRRTSKEFEVNPGLALLYLRKALSVFFSVKALNTSVNEKLTSWMEQQGTFILGKIEQLCRRLDVPVLETEKALICKYGKKVADTVPSLCEQKLSVKSCHDGQANAVSSNVVLYGSGEYARQFMAQQRADNMYNIIGIADSSIAKHGTTFEGLVIQKPSELLKLDSPIVICSFAFSQEIYSNLRQIGVSPDRLYKLF